MSIITENKKGYKKTKLGWIPEGWLVEKLGAISQIDKSSLSNNTDENYSFHYVSLSNIENGKISNELDFLKFKDAPSRARRKLKRNSILLATVRPNLQSFSIVEKETRNLIASTGFAIIDCYENYSSKYLFYYIFSYQLTKQIDALIVGSNYPAINSSEVKKLKIILPPLSEQQKIAKILSTWDKAIDKLSQLITQKEKYKKGLMQVLLTGKVRFDGFTEEWGEVKLGDVLVEGKLGGNYENSESNTGIPLMKMGNLDRGKFKFNKIENTSSNLNYDKEFILKEGDLLFNTRNTLDLVGKVAIWRQELTIALYNSNLMRMRFDERIETTNRFMNYYFNSYLGIKQLKSFAIGTTSVAAIYTRDLKRFKVLLPSIKEQKKIASVLTFADATIEKLNAQLEVLQNQKKGLMQELLTGKTRVKV